MYLLEQVAMYLVLIHQVGILSEETDFHKRSCYIFLRVGMEQQCSSTFQIRAFIKTQFLKQSLVVILQVCLFHSSAQLCISTEQIKCCIVQIIHSEIRHWHPIPSLALPPKHKAVESCTFQFLICGSTPLIIMTTITYRIRICLNNHFNISQTVSIQEIDIDDYSQHIPYLVRNILHQFLWVVNSNHLVLVVHANEHSASLRIGKAAYPLKVFVVPRLLKLYVLTFVGMYYCHSGT